MNGSKKNHVPYGLRDQLTVSSSSGGSMRAITFSFVNQSSSRGLEKFGENIPTIPEVIGMHTLNFKPNFKISSQFFFGVGGGASQFGCALANLVQSLARIKI